MYVNVSLITLVPTANRTLASETMEMTLMQMFVVVMVSARWIGVIALMVGHVKFVQVRFVSEFRSIIETHVLEWELVCMQIRAIVVEHLAERDYSVSCTCALESMRQTQQCAPPVVHALEWIHASVFQDAQVSNAN